MKRIEPFFSPMGSPEPNDWLQSYREPGQTFDEYLDSNPTLPTSERRTIYVLPLGKFTAGQARAITITAGYLESFFNLPVTLLPSQSYVRPTLGKDFRHNNSTRSDQVRTGYVMDIVLKPALRSDAAALIALTNDDLFPDESMNFVFGQASTQDRVGIWSLYHLETHTDFDTFLHRTLKIATHETAHMFSIQHCTKYECVMSGTNTLAETDGRPIDACPECMAKICWLSNISPKQRYQRLAEFCRKNALENDGDEFQRKANALDD